MSGGKLPEGWVGPQLDEIATDINYAIPLHQHLKISVLKCCV